MKVNKEHFKQMEEACIRVGPSKAVPLLPIRIIVILDSVCSHRLEASLYRVNRFVKLNNLNAGSENPPGKIASPMRLSSRQPFLCEIR